MAGGASAGGVGVPTPWWQIPGPVGHSAGDAANNLDASAPPGYVYDRVAMKYVPITKSAPNAQMLQDKFLNTLNGATGGVTGTGSAPTPGGYPGVGGYGGSGSAASLAGIPAGGPGQAGGGGGPVAPLAHVDTSAAQSAAFNTAKDKVGQVASGALTGLRSSLGGRGMLGSGAESKGTENIILGGEGQLGDVARAQAVDSSNQAREEATTNYQGDVAQRGQTLGNNAAIEGIHAGERNANLQSQTAQRGQDITAGTAKDALAQQKQLSLTTMLQSALSGLSGQLY